jgi:hypothetical protein
MNTIAPVDRPGTAPYLSVVVTTRNDDHGGDPLKRLQAFVNCFDEQCRMTGLEAEVIVVEWNPPADRPHVSSLLRLPQPAFCTYRFIEVPPEVHDRLRYADVLPLFQMIAKNVGIRRARGQFVLATNIDIIFSTELIAWLASRRLRPGRLYRVDRHDIQSALPLDVPLETSMSYCASHQLRLHTRNGSYPVDATGTITCLHEDIVDGCSVRLGEGWHVREGAGPPFYRWASDRAELIVDGAAIPGRGTVLDLDVESNPYDPRSWVDVEAFDGQLSAARVRITGRMRLQITLETANRDAARTIELRVVGTDETSRVHLPVFERRNVLHYRMHSARIIPAETAGSLLEYPDDGWADANPNSLQSVRSTPAGKEVSSDPRRWSYCIRYGPLRATSSGACRFEATCSLLEGRISLGVLQRNGKAWIPSSVARHQSGASVRLCVTVDLWRGQQFWLTICNDHPDGNGVSRFIVHRLEGSIDPAQARVSRPSGRRGSLSLEQLTATAADMAAFCAGRVSVRRWRDRLARLAGLVADVMANRMGDRMRGRIIRAASEYRAVEAALLKADEELRATAPLRDLTDLHKFLRERRPKNLHLNGCGDFQLMAREHWDQLRGYPEFETFSMNIDGLFSCVADAAGIEEETLPMPIYHLEHEVGSGWSPEGEALLRRRIAERGITWLDASTVYIWAAYMHWLGRPMIFNGADWGMGGHALDERSVAAACNTTA